MSEDITTQSQEANKGADETAKNANNQSQTIGEVLQTTKEPQTVGLDKFLEIKKQNKELQRALNEVQQAKANGASDSEISSSIESIAEEFEVDKKFIGKYSNAMKGELMKTVDEMVNERLAPLTAKQREEEVSKRFNSAFSETIAQMPEYKDIVNPDVIKALTLNPVNQNKTFSQIIEEAYGNAIQGRKTIEQTRTGGGKEPQGVDYDRAKTDMAYFKEVMSDPEMKQAYNKAVLSDISRRL